jgi:curved DNA-binding protein CbpA
VAEPSSQAETGELSTDEQAAIDSLWELSRSGDHYEMLGIADDADRRDVQRAFYDLSRQWHPDRFFRRELGEYQDRIETVFVAITEAYRTLSNDAARFTYDMERERNPGKHRRRAARIQREGSEAAGSKPDGASSEATPRRSRRSSTERRRVDARRKRALQAVRGQLRKDVRARKLRARELHKEGMEALEAGNIMKAASSLALACNFDPKNATYKADALKARKEARKVQSKQFLALAETAESYGNWREALQNWQKAIEYGATDARAHYRCGVLVKRVDEDNRAALNALREAVRLAPDSSEYRLTLGELYLELGLGLNAQRQAEAVLKVEKGNDRAKTLLKDSKTTG